MELIEFLTSKEIIVVYIVAAVMCLVCVIVYVVEKNNNKLRQKHNTRELNKLVEELKDEVSEDKNEVVYNEPVMEEVSAAKVIDAGSVVELLEATGELEVVNPVKVEEINTDTNTEMLDEVSLGEDSVEVNEPTITLVEEVKEETVLDPIEEMKEELHEELEYTSIEPDPETAREELEKITEELKKQEEKALEEDNNIKLTSYEETQEENAIISLEELVKKSKEMYAANELTQYADEGNVPISLTEFEKQVGNNGNVEEYSEPFIISNVVDEEEVIETLEEEAETVKLDDFNTVKVENHEEVKKFKSSPIISPIYGITKNEANGNDLELENTANYEKLDEEIRKTNEFLMTLKELQKHLD